MEKTCQFCGHWVQNLSDEFGFCFGEKTETEGNETSPLHSCGAWEEKDELE